MPYLYAKQVVVLAEEVVQEEELTHSVGEVEQFNDEIGDSQVVTVAFATHDEAVLGSSFVL